MLRYNDKLVNLRCLNCLLFVLGLYFKVTKNEKLAKVSWRYIMNQFKTRIEKYNYIRTQQKAKRMKAAKGRFL